MGVREELLDRLPGLSYWFGIKPRELETELTRREVDVYVAALDTIEARVAASGPDDGEGAG